MMINKIITKLIFWSVVIFLFVIPFFWFKSGELDLGGDSSRLYFYDAHNYLLNSALFSVDPQGVEKVSSGQYLLPLVFIISIFKSPYLINVLEKSLKLVFSFYFIYLIVKNLLNKNLKSNNLIIVEFSGILAGILYIFIPAVTINMKMALIQHYQVFLNPLIFYFLLKFFESSSSLYLWLILFISIIFAPNFAISVPPPYAFYPIVIIFLYIYTVKILKKTISWKKLIVFIIAFILLHFFYIFPTLQDLVNPGNYIHTRLAEATTINNPGLAYFDAIRSSGKVSINLFLGWVNSSQAKIAIFFPLIILLGFLLNQKKNNRILYLLGIFFLITIYLIGVNITNTGAEIYRYLFYIPGFSMFRNFGQFQWIFAFFYALLFGVSVGIIFAKLKLKYVHLLFFILILINIYISVHFLRGDIVNEPIYTTKIKGVLQMDPRYAETLKYIRNMPDNGKFLTLPLTDFFYQVIAGKNVGAYLGPSTISFLTGKADFAGYQILYPFPEVLLKLTREKDITNIKRLLTLLNIRYIFYNSDVNIYDQSFSGYPYSYMRKSLPNTQEGYAEFISQLKPTIIYQNGLYQIFDIGIPTSLIYVPDQIQIYQNDRNDWYGQNMTFFLGDNNPINKSAYILDSVCDKYLSGDLCGEKTIKFDEIPGIQIEKINPTKYLIKLNNPPKPFILVFSNGFDNSWKLYINNQSSSGPVKNIISNFTDEITNRIFSDKQIFQTINKKEISTGRHFTINGYANAWEVNPGDLNGTNEIILETKAQQYFYVSFAVSLSAFIVFIIWGIILLKNRLMML